MKLFFWKNNKQIDMFARNMADELYSQVHPELMEQYFSDKVDKKQKKHVERKLGDVERQVKQFQVANKLGVYSKARLQLNLMERLQQLGYEKHISRKVNDHMLIKSS